MSNPNHIRVVPKERKVSNTIPSLPTRPVSPTTSSSPRSRLPRPISRILQGPRPLPPSPPRRSLSPSIKAPPPSVLARAAKMSNCTHLTMTRLFTTEFVCSVCYKPGEMGWLWRCTEDREELLENDMTAGVNNLPLDAFNDIFGRRSTPRPRGPAARADPESFVKEMTEEQKASYTPEQLAIIQAQRDNVRKIAAEQAAKENDAREQAPSTGRFGFIPMSPATNPFLGALTNNGDASMSTDTTSFAPPKGFECQYKVCPACRPTYSDRSFLSMDGIANGDIPATAQTGYGFNLVGKLPVADANIMKTIGLRAVPLPRGHPARPAGESTSFSASADPFAFPASAGEFPQGLLDDLAAVGVAAPWHLDLSFGREPTAFSSGSARESSAVGGGVSTRVPVIHSHRDLVDTPKLAMSVPLPAPREGEDF